MAGVEEKCVDKPAGHRTWTAGLPYLAASVKIGVSPCFLRVPMHHDTDLINIVAVGLGLAFIFGALANKLRLSPLVGYLVAGICVGPFTPGFVADQALANQLAELGVMLLMFGVGLHFSLKDLMAVKAIAIPGAIGQIAVATLLGWGVASLMGWPAIHGVIFGFSLAPLVRWCCCGRWKNAACWRRCAARSRSAG